METRFRYLRKGLYRVVQKLIRRRGGGTVGKSNCGRQSRRFNAEERENHKKEES